MSQREETLNIYLGRALRGMRRRWQIQTENLGALYGSRGYPDILITEPGAAPLVIEHETMPALDVESEAKNRLGRLLRDSPQDIRASIALRSPAALRKLDETRLAAALRADDPEIRFEYALFRGRIPCDAERWPERGWLRGRLQDLALLAQQAMRPSEEIDVLAEILEKRIESAEVIFTNSYPEGRADVAEMLAEHLKIIDDEKHRQTRRMAISIIANALIFQQILVPELSKLRMDLRESLQTPHDLYHRNQPGLRKGETISVWRTIRDKVDYHPIFDVAIKILDWIQDPIVASAILNELFHVVDDILHKRIARSHELTGHVFQRLITDRKFLATFYTHPSSAALLATLALPKSTPLMGKQWGDAAALQETQIADFACGTGTLLSAIYERISALHELNGGNAQKLHKAMMEKALVGCDVLPLAVHMTLSMLASAHPEEPFFRCGMIATPYGKQKEPLEKEYALGSLELIQQERIIPTLATQQTYLIEEFDVQVTAVGGHGEEDITLSKSVPHGAYDLVIMNPPFTRPGGHEGKKVGVSVPAFAGLQNTREEQHAMSKKLSQLAKDICYDGKAGLGSAFVALADKKLSDDGVMAFVLPITLIQGEAWRKVRRLLARQYRDITVITIAQPKPPHTSFSMDTGMGECLLIARRGARAKVDSPRATFVCLDSQPRTVMEGSLIGELIHQKQESGLRRLEDTATSGTILSIGEEKIGSIIDAPIDENPWRIESVRDMATVQTAFHLAAGRVLLPHWPTGDAIPMTQVAELAEIGPYHQQIYRTDGKGAFEKIDSVSAADSYPMLWSHDAHVERCFIVEPDSHGQTNDHDRALEIAKTASHVHHNRDFRFNSQSLSAAWTERKTIGGRAWPSLIFNDSESAEMAFMVWANSTLGVLCYWWHATKQQSGRGMIPITAVGDMPTLDLRRLSPEQLAAAARLFHDHKQLPMLPVNQIDEDENRAELDRRLLTEALGLPAELCTGADSPLALLRRKLAAEPSIHGGKKSKVAL